MKRPILACLLLWAVLALVIVGQDRTSKTKVCDHGGNGTPIDLDQVEATYRELEASFRKLVSSQVQSPRLQATIAFEAGLERSLVARREIELPREMPKAILGNEILVGERRDFEGIDSSNGRRIFLLTRVENLNELALASASLGRVGLATPEVIRFFNLRNFPVRITFKDSRHAAVETLR